MAAMTADVNVSFIEQGKVTRRPQCPQTPFLEEKGVPKQSRTWVLATSLERRTTQFIDSEMKRALEVCLSRLADMVCGTFKSPAGP